MSKIHPCRQILLFHIITGLPKEIAMDLFQISQRTMQRINKIKNKDINKIKWTKITQKQIEPKYQKQLELAESIIGDIIPIISGRNYRIQKQTNKELYKQYKQQVKIFGQQQQHTNNPLSLSTITRHILKKWNIYHSKDTIICPTCLILENYHKNNAMPTSFLENQIKKLHKRWIKKYNKDTPIPDQVMAKCINQALLFWERKIAKIQHHPQKIKDQFKAYRQTKEKLSKGELLNTVIVVQDFTQLQSQSTFNQDLIIVILNYKKRYSWTNSKNLSSFYCRQRKK